MKGHSNAALAARAQAWALELVARPSVTGTAEEAAFASWLAERLAALPAFSAEGGGVWTIPVPGCPLGRASVAALARGRGARTIVLTGHFDTVRTDDYGDLAPLATRPSPLREALVDRLQSPGKAAEALALADLESGRFLPGRGLLDMKAGLAAGLAAIEAFAAAPPGDGSLLFLAVPDEETSSAGARSVARALPELAQRLGLSLEAAVNLDALVDAGDGSAGRRVALGSVGKLLPSAFVVGRSTHAADALHGLNAAALAAALTARIEWAPELTERTVDEVAAPPTLLGLSDGRLTYDVTTPERAWAYWNVMIHRRRPAELLETFARVCQQAAQSFVGDLGRRAGVGMPDVPVITFAALRHQVLAAGGAPAEKGLAAVAADAATRGLDLPGQCRLITEHLWIASRRTGPAVVVGFASMPYLPVELRGGSGRRLARAVELAVDRVGSRHGQAIGVCRYFPGISDMSFLGQVDAAAMPDIAANTPAWGHGIAWPDGPPTPGLPIVNAGPWGRDYHTPLERLHTGYAFEVLPELLLEIVRGLWAPDGGAFTDIPA